MADDGKWVITLTFSATDPGARPVIDVADGCPAQLVAGAAVWLDEYARTEIRAALVGAIAAKEQPRVVGVRGRLPQ